MLGVDFKYDMRELNKTLSFGLIAVTASANFSAARFTQARNITFYDDLCSRFNNKNKIRLGKKSSN